MHQIVQSRETLGGIATQHNASITRILSAISHILKRYRLGAGASLKHPAGRLARDQIQNQHRTRVMTARNLLPLVAALLACGCSPDSADDIPQRELIALEALQENTVSTHLTALVEINDAFVDDPGMLVISHSDEDPLTVRYKATLVENYVGDGPDALEFTGYVQKSEGVNKPDVGIRIISLCMDNDGGYYLPDIGFQLPATTRLMQRAQELKTQLAARDSSADNAKRGSACE